MAILELSARHGWVVTYEDPRWAHEYDVEDVTDRYPEAARKVATGELPYRLLQLRSKRLEFSYETYEVTTRRDGEHLVSRLVREKGEGFEVRESGGMPTWSGRSGRWSPVASVRALLLGDGGIRPVCREPV